MTEIGRPPVLRVLHQGMQVLDYGVEVEALEFLGIVERFAHRIGGGRVRMEHSDIEVLWPPVAVPVSAGAAGERALACAIVSLCIHVSLRSCSRCRLWSFIGGGQPWLLLLPAGGAGRI